MAISPSRIRSAAGRLSCSPRLGTHPPAESHGLVAGGCVAALCRGPRGPLAAVHYAHVPTEMERQSEAPTTVRAGETLQCKRPVPLVEGGAPIVDRAIGVDCFQS